VAAQFVASRVVLSSVELVKSTFSALHLHMQQKKNIYKDIRRMMKKRYSAYVN
jgi:hypothetical protein